MVLLDINLPFPPSMNSLWRSVGKRWYMTKRGSDYRRDVQLILREKKIKSFGCEQFLAVEFYFTPPDMRRRDLDNLQKAILDSLKGILFGDDVQIKSLKATMGLEPIKGGNMHMILSSYVANW
jgi:crossover junction endodeoxyribonuclease RusA